MFFGHLKGKFSFILCFILLIEHSIAGYNDSLSKSLNTQEISVWETDTTSSYGQFVKPAADNMENILIWKPSENRGDFIKNAIVFRNSVYLTFWYSNTAVCINLDSSTQKAFRVSDKNLFPPHEPFIACDEVDDNIMLTTSKRIRIFDESSLKLERDVNVSLDYRIRPILFDNDLIFIEGYRGESIIRMNVETSIVWKCNLPGYVMSDPAVYGSVMIIQTRQGSYGGQATTAVNLTDGKILWSETTNTYGYGACFGDDAYLCYESDLYLNPQKTEGWIICRTTKNGERKWRHIQRGALLHYPIFEKEKNNLYAVFSEFTDSTRSGGENEVVCLKADTGSIRWKSKLATAVRRPPSSSSDHYWLAISLQNNMLMVLDEKDVLHFFEPNNGSLLLSMDLNPIKQLCSVPRRKTEIINMPLIIKDKLLVITNYGFVLYPIKYSGLT